MTRFARTSLRFPARSGRITLRLQLELNSGSRFRIKYEGFHDPRKANTLRPIWVRCCRGPFANSPSTREPGRTAQRICSAEQVRLTQQIGSGSRTRLAGRSPTALAGHVLRRESAAAYDAVQR